MKIHHGRTSAKRNLRIFAAGSVLLGAAGFGLAQLAKTQSPVDAVTDDYISINIVNFPESLQPNFFPDLSAPEIPKSDGPQLFSTHSSTSDLQQAVVDYMRDVIGSYDGSKPGYNIACADAKTQEEINSCLLNGSFYIPINDPFGLDLDNIDNVSSIYENLFYNTLYENPELFYAMTGVYTGVAEAQSGEKVVLVFPWILEEFDAASELNTGKTKFNNAIADWEKEIFGDDVDEMSDLEKALSAYSVMMRRNNYTGVSLLQQNKLMSEDVPYSMKAHTAYGALVDHDSVCQGIAAALNLLLNRADVSTVTTVSDNHAWNHVEINGKYYLMDATWDDPFPATFYKSVYLNFLQSDSASGHDAASGQEGTNRFGITAPDAYTGENFWINSGTPIIWDNDADALTMVDNIAQISKASNGAIKIEPASATTFSTVNVAEDGEVTKNAYAEIQAPVFDAVEHDDVIYYTTTNGNIASYDLTTQSAGDYNKAGTWTDDIRSLYLLQINDGALQKLSFNWNTGAYEPTNLIQLGESDTNSPNDTPGEGDPGNEDLEEDEDGEFIPVPNTGTTDTPAAPKTGQAGSFDIQAVAASSISTIAILFVIAKIGYRSFSRHLTRRRFMRD
ncbi:MAG: hypothetical protein Q4B29_00620 [Candidatus Saccharibacteria bacterium]|nr:hypothetical protein [Candidatus Saccharibacteria bacterium]